MNPTLQQFMPGIGQPIRPEDLANGLQMFKGQGATLGNAPTLGNAQAMEQEQAANLAQLMESYKAAQGQSQMGESMMAPQYVQNSGGLGALAMIAQAAAGKKMRREANESASEYAGRIFEEEQRQSAAQAEAAAKAQEAQLARQWAREDQRDETKAQREERLAMLRIDAADRRAAQTAEARLAAARIGASAAGQGGGAQVLSEDEAKAIGLTPGTVAQRDRNGKISILQAPKSVDPVQARADNEVAAARTGLADDALRFAANYTGKSIDELAKMTPEEIGNAVRDQGGRITTGPIMGRVLGSNAVNDDLVAFAESAAAKQARINSPVGPITDPDLAAARLQVWGPTLRPGTNAQLVQRAIEAARGGQPAATAAPAGGVDALLEKYR